MRKLIALFMSLLLCLTLFISIVPAACADDGGIKKLQVQTYEAPVATREVSSIAASTCTSNCEVTYYGWFNENTGMPLKDVFGTEKCRIEITVNAINGRFFSNEVAVTLNGEPADFVVSEDRTVITLYRVYIPEIWAPYVMNEVFNESVMAGGRVCFDAWAEYAEDCTWYFFDPITNTAHGLDELAVIYPGVTYNDSTHGVLYLYDVTAEMNGCGFFAVFTGMGGSVPTLVGTLYVQPVEGVSAMPPYTPETANAPVEAVAEEPAELLDEQAYSETAQTEAAPVSELSAESVVELISDYSSDMGNTVEEYFASISGEPVETVEETVEETANVAEPAEPEEHTHAYFAQWKHDSRQHYVECECGARAYTAAHSMVWKVTREPTKAQSGNKVGVCSICGFRRDVPIAYVSADKEKVIDLRDASAAGVLKDFVNELSEKAVIIIVSVLFIVPAVAVIIALRKEELSKYTRQ